MQANRRFEYDFLNCAREGMRFSLVAAPHFPAGGRFHYEAVLEDLEISTIEVAMDCMFDFCGNSELFFKPRIVTIYARSAGASQLPEVAGFVSWGAPMAKPKPVIRTYTIAEAEVSEASGQTSLELMMVPVGCRASAIKRRIILESSDITPAAEGRQEFWNLCRSIGLDDVEDAEELMFRDFRIAVHDGQIVQYLLPDQRAAVAA